MISKYIKATISKTLQSFAYISLDRSLRTRGGQNGTVSAVFDYFNPTYLKAKFPIIQKNV